ncbi:gliding motility-associated C-terminal domain-containing protein [Mucilaginibacter sp. FT3.2]|uniref:gliding motility-associated C-terminal domain-containing protein n=1 Tax=Mucilaginibacter sp. FT3.2 TaxID=2723090 RepID=UPI00161450FB|nr:gliding motility-associated C-terminal domain-containing protein [Mucilaginibacter sp. FT3.2]MBB6232210.1 gliding motility-associated-like protein [Mucilaginibacter sp. FT3.2]
MLTLILLLACLRGRSAVFTVTSNADSGPGTLRDALTLAAGNGVALQDIIQFNLPGTGAAALTIKLLTQLPEVSSNLIIDGSTQPGPKLGNSDAKVYIVPDVNYTFPGTKAAAFVMTETTNVDIYGICVKGYDSRLENFNGKLIFAAVSAYDCINVTIGGPGRGNVFADNIYGIYCGTASLTDAKNNTNIIIQSNFIGYDESGTNAVELGFGVDLTTDNSNIGGPDPQDRNYFANQITINGSGNSVVNNSLSLDINRQNNRVAGSSILVSCRGANLNITNNDFCAAQFQLISVSGFTFTGNKQSAIPGNSSLYLSECSSGYIGGETDNSMNFFNNDGGAFFAEGSSGISVLKNSITCNNKAYAISNGAGVPAISVLVNTNAEFSGTGSPGAIVYIYNDNTGCAICNPVQFFTTATVNNTGNWKITGDFTTQKLIANATLNNNSSEFTQPVISSAPADLDIIQPSCGHDNGSITIKNLKNVTTVSWYKSDGQFLKNGPVLDGVGPGVYYAKCFSGLCSASSENFQLRNFNPVINTDGFKKEDAHCGINNGSIRGLKAPDISNGAFTPVWTNQNGDIIAKTIDVDGIGPGTYTLLLSSNQCAVPYGPVSITNEDIVLSAPVINSFQVCTPGAAILPVSNPNTAGVYRLYDSESSVSPLDEQASGVFNILITANRSYYVSQYNSGCESQRTKVDVTVSLSALNIANAITPNADGVNDYWKITGIENYPQATVKIFNRNGQAVFQSIGYSRPFDGTYNKQKLPAGVYYYIINLNAGCNVLSGSLTIIR